MKDTEKLSGWRFYSWVSIIFTLFSCAVSLYIRLSNYRWSTALHWSVVWKKSIMKTCNCDETFASAVLEFDVGYGHSRDLLACPQPMPISRWTTAGQRGETVEVCPEEAQQLWGGCVGGSRIWSRRRSCRTSLTTTRQVGTFCVLFFFSLYLKFFSLKIVDIILEKVILKHPNLWKAIWIQPMSDPIHCHSYFY